MLEFSKEIVAIDTPKKQSALTSLLNTPTPKSATSSSAAVVHRRRPRAMSSVENQHMIMYDDDDDDVVQPSTTIMGRPPPRRRRASESSVDFMNYTSSSSTNVPVLVYFPSGARVSVIIPTATSCTVRQLIEYVLNECCNSDANVSNSVELRVSSHHTNNDGAVPDDDFPPLDERRMIHRVGTTVFVLWPLSAHASMILSRVRFDDDDNGNTKHLLMMPNTQQQRQHQPPNVIMHGDAKVSMFHAAESGDLTRLQQLIESGQAAANATGIDNWTVLHFAARCDHGHIIHYLMKNTDADIDARTKTQWTPLHLAAFQGHSVIAETLLMYGASKNAQTHDGYTAAQLAEQQSHHDIVELFESYDDDVDDNIT